MGAGLVEHIPSKRIEVRSNIRDRLVEAEQVSLAQCIKANGILVPLLGYREGDAVVVLDGHRRLDAANRAGLDAVPMIVAEHAPTPAELLTLQLVANCQRSSLKTMERVRAIAKLMTESGWSASEVSIRLGGPSEATISKLMALLVLPREVQDLIDAGRIPISSGYVLATVTDPNERAPLVAGVLDGSLKRDQLVTRVKSLKNKQQRVVRPRRTNRPPRERVTVPLGPGRAVTVVGPGLSADTLVAWLEDLVNRIRGFNTPGVGLKDMIGLLKSIEPAIGSRNSKGGDV